jgi:hypothetical protein
MSKSRYSNHKQQPPSTPPRPASVTVIRQIQPRPFLTHSVYQVRQTAASLAMLGQLPRHFRFRLVRQVLMVNSQIKGKLA